MLSLPRQMRLLRLIPRFCLGTICFNTLLHLLAAVAKCYFHSPAEQAAGEVALMLAGVLLLLTYKGDGWPYYMSIPFVFYTLCGSVAPFLHPYYLQIGFTALLVQSTVFCWTRFRPQ